MDSKDLVLIDDQIVNQIRSILIDRKETVSVAESVTAGIMQTTLASAKDALRFFHGGITAYNLGQKARHLKVNPIHAEACNCVSKQIAENMALEVCKLFSSDWGIGITGYATIDTAVRMKKPFAYYAIVFNNRIQDSGLLKHEKDQPALIQYYYVNEILNRLKNVAIKNSKHAKQ